MVTVILLVFHWCFDEDLGVSEQLKTYVELSIYSWYCMI